jgi:hypothetical protein
MTILADFQYYQSNKILPQPPKLNEYTVQHSEANKREIAYAQTTEIVRRSPPDYNLGSLAELIKLDEERKTIKKPVMTR